MSYVTWLETCVTMINVHLVLCAFGGHIRTRSLVLSVLLLFPFLIFPICEQTLIGQISIVLDFAATLFLPLITVRDIPKNKILYISTFYVGVSSAIVISVLWVGSAICPSRLLAMLISASVNMLFLILGIFLYHKKWLYRFSERICLISKSAKWLVWISVWLCATLAYILSELFYELPKSGPLLTAEVLTALVILLIGISIPLFVVNNISSAYYQNVSASVRSQMERQALYYEKMYRINEELRRFKHDYKNLRIGLLCHLKEGDAASALETLQKGERIYFTEKVYYETGNAIADALLSEKADVAAQYGVIIRFDGLLPGELIAPSDICIILGNLLDNAIEACLALSTDEAKVIQVKATYHNRYLFMCIQNPVHRKLYMIDGHIATTKKKPTAHGMGLYAVENAVKRYNGDFKITNDNEMFSVDICLDFNESQIQVQAQ